MITAEEKAEMQQVMQKIADRMTSVFVDKDES